MPEWEQQPGGYLTIDFGDGWTGHVKSTWFPETNRDLHAGWLKHESGVDVSYIIGESVDSVKRRLEMAPRDTVPERGVLRFV